jgi:hypothetical protein
VRIAVCALLAAVGTMLIGVGANGAGHKPAAPINVCKTVPAKVVRAIPGVGSTCSETSPLPGVGSVEYTGTWTANPGTAEEKEKGGTKIEESLGVTIARFSDSAALKLAVQNLNQGLPGGPVTAVEHLGGPAYEAEAEKTAAIHISWKDYTGYVTLAVVNAATPSPKVLEALAKVLTETY